ncbi:MAG: 5'-nucleotidase C-terminal domain-containing protein [Spirochaetaceae bacterium]|jgi:5'-nucleotidase/UDP-sugar diphosphatase|nr:5'-nucleotidase C-terminal domain-containing protein [Spirochaetaceae bacterium]
MKRNVILLVCTIITGIFLTACAGTAPAATERESVTRDPDTVYSLVVLHTNDHHGTTLSKDTRGGLAERSSYIKAVRDSNTNVLLLDAGDINTGSALSNMFHAEPDILAYNLMQYDAVTMGNHEFDNKIDFLETQMNQSAFPWLSANIQKSDGSYLGTPYITLDYEGFRVGVFGLTTLRTTIIASPDKSLVFLDEIETAKHMVQLLKEQEKADVIIALTHMGLVKETDTHITSIDLAEAVPGINLVIDGHSHTLLDEPVIAAGTPIVSANEWGKYVGNGVLSITNGTVTGFSWQSVLVDSSDTSLFPPNPEVVTLLAPYAEKASAALSEVIGSAAETFEFGDRLSRKKEIALGNLVSDATVWYVGTKGVAVDFAFQNGGNIRTELPAGDITRERIVTILPFDNYIYVLTLKGSDVIALFDFIAAIPQGAGGFPQISREAAYTVNYETGKIEGLTINGQPVDASKTYRIATNDYLAGGGDGYEVLKRATDTFNTSITLTNAVIEYIQQLPQPILPATEGRITIIGGMEL